jgi:hypothetical protein
VTVTPINPYPANPAWPAEWQGATLTGRFIDVLGNPIVGSVIFVPEVAAVLARTAKRTVISVSREVVLDVNGAFSITVPATDDPDVNPSGFTYKVTENFPNGRTYSIPAPMNVTTDLSTLAPVPSSGGTPIIRGPQGDPGIRVVALGAPAPAGLPDNTLIIELPS